MLLWCLGSYLHRLKPTQTSLWRLLIIYTIDPFFFSSFFVCSLTSGWQMLKKVKDQGQISNFWMCDAKLSPPRSLGDILLMLRTQAVCQHVRVSSVSSCVSPVACWQQRRAGGVVWPWIRQEAVLWFTCHCLENTIICVHLAMSIILS